MRNAIYSVEDVAAAEAPCNPASDDVIHQHNTTTGAGLHYFHEAPPDTAGDAAAGDEMDPYVLACGERYSTASCPYFSYSSERSSISQLTPDGSPCIMSPWHAQFPSQWSQSSTGPDQQLQPQHRHGTAELIGSLVREEGHIYSLAAVGDLLYTGSDSKNIRVWKNYKDFSGFKSSSGLIKAIVISGNAADRRIFTGHQDGKIRVWRASHKNAAVHKRAGSLPRLRDYLMSSIKPSNYIEGRRRRSFIWLKHSDAISCLFLHQEQGLLYSGSWDRTFKIWRLSDSRCLESVAAHDDAVNSVVAAGFVGGLVYTGSADGTVKAWRREMQPKGITKHTAVQTLLKQESAITSLAVSPTAPVVYCGSSDGVVNFWEWDRGQVAHGGELRGHTQAVLCLTAAGSLVLSGSADRNICVWRREGGGHTCLSVLNGHTGPVKCLSVVEDYRNYSWIVYSGSLDKSVKVWKVEEQSNEAGPQHVPVDDDNQHTSYEHGREASVHTTAL